MVLPLLFHSAQRGGSSPASLRETYVLSLNSLEQENRQLRQALSEMRARSDDYEQAHLRETKPDQPQPARSR